MCLDTTIIQYPDNNKGENPIDREAKAKEAKNLYHQWKAEKEKEKQKKDAVTIKLK